MAIAGIFGLLISLIMVAVGIGSLVCWVLVIVAAFQNEDSPLWGVLSIVLCGLGAFVIGWIKHQEWGIQKVMIIWSLLIVTSIVLQVLAGVMFAGVPEMDPGM